VVNLEREQKADILSSMWMGANLQYKDLQGVLETLQAPHGEDTEPSVEEVNTEWKRLASFMQGHK